MSTDAPDAFIWSEAGAADEAAVLALMRAFYAEERLDFCDAGARTAVRQLLGRPEVGRVFLLRAGGADFDKNTRRGVVAVGHLVLTFGFSLEFRGRFVLLDEVYLAPQVRGKGWGRRAIEFAVAWAREQGAASLRLEVNHANTRAKEIYSRRGFGDDRRDLMTRWVRASAV